MEGIDKSDLVFKDMGVGFIDHANDAFAEIALDCYVPLVVTTGHQGLRKTLFFSV